MQVTLPEGLTSSPLHLDDLTDLVVLIQLVDLRTLGQIETSPDDLRALLSSPGIDPARDGLVVRNAAGTVVGFVLVQTWSAGNALVNTYSHPEFWDDERLDEWLLLEGIQRAEGLAAMAGGGAWTAIVFATDDDVRLDLLDRLGFVEVGVHWRMEIRFERRAPDVPQPQDLVLRNPDGEADLQLVHGLVDAASATRPDHRAETWQQFHHERVEHPAFDDRLWFIAETEDGTPLGAIVGHYDEAAKSGWIGLLGVVPEARGRGVGTALLNATFRAFHAQGVGRVELGVDATPELDDDEPAVERRSRDGFDGPGNRVTALYERAGMRPVFRHTRHHLAL